MTKKTKPFIDLTKFPRGKTKIIKGPRAECKTTQEEYMADNESEEKELIDLIYGRRKPENERDRKILKEIEQMKKEGKMIDVTGNF